MNGYVWYSYGSDTTGPALADALGFKHGKKTPKFGDFDIIIGWGCKPGTKYNAAGLGELIKTGEIRVLNHPDAVHANRNKLAALGLMSEHGVSVPGFETDGNANALFKATLKALEDGELEFPLLGLNSHHKGYPFFCYTVEDVERAMKSTDPRVQYFRSFCPGEEFKIYVFRDTALAAEKKTLSADPQKQLAEHLRKKLQRRAKKGEAQLRATAQELGWVAEELAGQLLTGPHHMQRSVTHGWELQGTPLDQVPKTVISEAIEAIEALGLDMGAVSVTQDEKYARVTNVTSAPGLSEEQMNLYVSAIREFAKAKKAKPAKKEPVAREAKAEEEDAAPRELVARLKKKMSGLTKAKAAEVLKALED